MSQCEVTVVRLFRGFPMKAASVAHPGRPFSPILPTAWLTILLVASLAPSAWAGEWSGSCDNRFRGSSTLHDFAGNVRCQPFSVRVDDAADGRTIVPGAEVAILVGEMDTDNGSRDRQMREMFQIDRFPRIRGTFDKFDPEKVRQELRRGPRAGVPLEFTLTIRDIERPVHAIAGNFRETGSTVSFDVDYAVSLKDFGLVPPKALFGLVKVDDRITVKTAVRLEAAGAK
jgi:polyisoprenoid-binding protein YceI